MNVCPISCLGFKHLYLIWIFECLVILSIFSKKLFVTASKSIQWNPLEILCYLLILFLLLVLFFVFVSSQSFRLINNFIIKREKKNRLFKIRTKQLLLPVICMQRSKNKAIESYSDEATKRSMFCQRIFSSAHIFLNS